MGCPLAHSAQPRTSGAHGQDVERPAGVGISQLERALESATGIGRRNGAPLVLRGPRMQWLKP